MKITVVGAGYVGLSNAIMLAQHFDVFIYDIDQTRIERLQKGVSPIKDSLVSEFLTSQSLSLHPTKSAQEAYEDADYVLVATPTDFDAVTNRFDTSSIESTIDCVRNYSSCCTIIIRSTLPIGYLEDLANAGVERNCVVMPEFLREGNALLDCLYPSRIIVGFDTSSKSLAGSVDRFTEAMLKCIRKGHDEIKILCMTPSEAEAVKLFSNTYLAMRVAFFNELDTFASVNKYDSRNIISGVSLDPRIGDYYNNPSFGYGGYCLPKDSQQLAANYQFIPNALMKAVVDANRIRKEFIIDDIVAIKAQTIGIYRLTMKTGSDNFRHSAILDVLAGLHEKGLSVLIYEPEFVGTDYCGHEITKDLRSFKERADLIVANRYSDELENVKDRIYTKDLYHED